MVRHKEPNQLTLQNGPKRSHFVSQSIQNSGIGFKFGQPTVHIYQPVKSKGNVQLFGHLVGNKLKWPNKNEAIRLFNHHGPTILNFKLGPRDLI